MKTSKRFNNVVSKLVKAYFNGELGKGHCTMCAVGNMCNGEEEWNEVFGTNPDNCFQHITPSHYKEKGKEIIDSTGYSWRELAKIEFAFESNTELHYTKYRRHSQKEIDQDQFNGLIAVVDVLCKIEGYDNNVLKETKEMFIKI